LANYSLLFALEDDLPALNGYFHLNVPDGVGSLESATKSANLPAVMEPFRVSPNEANAPPSVQMLQPSLPSPSWRACSPTLPQRRFLFKKAKRC